MGLDHLICIPFSTHEVTHPSAAGQCHLYVHGPRVENIHVLTNHFHISDKSQECEHWPLLPYGCIGSVLTLRILNNNHFITLDMVAVFLQAYPWKVGHESTILTNVVCSFLDCTTFVLHVSNHPSPCGNTQLMHAASGSRQDLSALKQKQQASCLSQSTNWDQTTPRKSIVCCQPLLAEEDVTSVEGQVSTTVLQPFAANKFPRTHLLRRATRNHSLA